MLHFSSGQHKNARLAAYGAPVISGVVLILAFPPYEQGYLGWFALIPLLWFCLIATPRQALLGGLLFSLPLNWHLNLYLSGVLFTHLSAALALFSMAMLILIICTFYSLFALAVCYYSRGRFSLSLIFLIPTLWVLMEYARSVGFFGYTVGFLGYTQWSYPFVLGLTSVYGYWGLSYLMVAVQTLFVLALLRTVKRKSLATGAALVAAMFWLGLALPAIIPEEGKGELLPTAMIQGNSRPEEILSVQGRKVIFNRYLEMTRRAAQKNPGLKFVVWPETVVDLDLTNTCRNKLRIKALTEELDLEILFGARVKDNDRLYNAAVLLSPGKEAPQIYYKQLLVPFVEYFPMYEWLNDFLNLELLLGRYTPGEKRNLLTVRETPVAAVICFESYFGSYTRHFSQIGAQHLFVLTNDVWFDQTIGKELHAQVASIRAAEMGIGVTQVANSGITTSFDYRGRELFRSEKSEPGIYTLPIELTRQRTVYSIAGDYFPAFWLAFLSILTLHAIAHKYCRRVTG